MNTKKILVIEDNQKHLADAKTFFADKPEYQVEYVENGNKAMTLLRDTAYSAVVTDIFMPWDEQYPNEEPIGFGIAMFCQKQKIPCVMNTAVHHHGARHQWISTLIYDLGLPQAVRAYGVDREAEAETKKWPEVAEKLRGLCGV